MLPDDLWYLGIVADKPDKDLGDNSESGGILDWDGDACLEWCEYGSVVLDTDDGVVIDCGRGSDAMDECTLECASDGWSESCLEDAAGIREIGQCSA